MRISTSSPQFTALPPRAGDLKPQVQATDTVDELQTILFGTVRPKVLDLANFPELAQAFRFLKKFKTKLAAFGGDRDDDYDLQLAEGANACVDRHGTIFIGEGLLKHGEPALVVGVLAHEVGHRPKTWRKHQKEALNRQALLQLAREEEAKADKAAGRALAELGISCEPLCTYLQRHGNFEKPPENYFPVEVRIEMIREAHAAQKARRTATKRLFPGLAKESPRHLIADGAGPKKASGPRVLRKTV